MATDTAELSFSDAAKELGDKIMSLTLKEAKELSDYLKSLGIEPAGGGAVMVTGPVGPGDAAPAEEVKDEFDVVLAGFDSAKKIAIIKVVRAVTGLGLKEAKALVEEAPKPVKTGLSKEDADKLKAELEEAGAQIELK